MKLEISKCNIKIDGKEIDPSEIKLRMDYNTAQLDAYYEHIDGRDIEVVVNEPDVFLHVAGRKFKVIEVVE